MNSIDFIKKQIICLIQEVFGLEDQAMRAVEVKIEIDSKFGDLSCNAAMVLAGKLKISPIQLANKIKDFLTSELINDYENPLASHIEVVSVAGPGFLNIKLTDQTWHTVIHELFAHPKKCFQLYPDEHAKSYLIEFVSANPTGPLTLGHGRNAIIGDVLSTVLSFLGHKVTREFYINDAGSQIEKLAKSVKLRCQELLGQKIEFPEDGYAGSYIVDLAKEIMDDFCHANGCASNEGCGIENQPLEFFKERGYKKMLKNIKHDLESYGVFIDIWFSEFDLHKNGKVEQAVQLLGEKGFLFQEDGCTWFKSTHFGDDKDRVIKKSDGSFTYIAPDVAYHKDKFDRGFDVIVDVLGQDHHSYANRLRATMAALGFDLEKFKIILYQLVSIKQDGQAVRMSKRAGNFQALADVVENVGRDVARYFFLNKKPDAHLEFDIELATTRDMNNPVFYLQYAYVRAKSVIRRACQDLILGEYAQKLMAGNTDEISLLREKPGFHNFGEQEIVIIKKVCALRDVLFGMATNFQTNLIAAYAHELAGQFHSFYNSNKVIDPENIDLSKSRLIIVRIIENTLALSMDLMGISKPDKM